MLHEHVFSRRIDAASVLRFPALVHRTICPRFPGLFAFLESTETAMTVDPRIQKALELLEQAQRLARQAAEVLHGTPEFDDQRTAVCDLEEAIGYRWRRLERATQTEQARKAKEDAYELS